METKKNILIKDIKPIKRAPLVASFTVIVPKWGDFYIRSVIACEKDGRRWIFFPSEPYEKDGKKKFSARCGFVDPKMHESFQHNLLEAFDLCVKENPSCMQIDMFEENIPF